MSLHSGPRRVPPVRPSGYGVPLPGRGRPRGRRPAVRPAPAPLRGSRPCPPAKPFRYWFSPRRQPISNKRGPAAGRAKARPHLEQLEDRLAPAIAYQVPGGTLGNQAFGGSLGMDFNVNQPVVVTQLGVFDSGSDGLQLPLTARLYD